LLDSRIALGSSEFLNPRAYACPLGPGDKDCTVIVSFHTRKWKFNGRKCSACRCNNVIGRFRNTDELELDAEEELRVSVVQLGRLYIGDINRVEFEIYKERYIYIYG
jgi:hypothetical protein